MDHDSRSRELVVVYVTRAQVRAAKALIELRERAGKPVSDAVRKIAEAGRER